MSKKTTLLKIAASLFFSASLVSCKQDTVLEDTQGHKIALNNLQKGLVMIHYWASWCGSCQAEIPRLNQFYHSHQKNIAFYGVEYDHLDPAALNKAMQAFHIEFPVLNTDPGELLALDAVGVVPTTFVLYNGQVVDTLLGPQTESGLSQVLIRHQKK